MNGGKVVRRLIIVGSPRIDGRSAALADLLFEACIDECPDDAVSMISVSSLEFQPCIGCDMCCDPLDGSPQDTLVKAEGSSDPQGSDETPDKLSAQAETSTHDDGDPLSPQESVMQSDAFLHQCIYDDEFAEVRKHLDACDELTVVTPVYFASVPSQFKALLDRLQPYFWSTLRNQPKRPLTIHVVGEGGDPHGFDPLIGTVRSALSCAGFQLTRVLDWVGKIDVSGEILEDADEYPFKSLHPTVRMDSTPDEGIQRIPETPFRGHEEKPQLSSETSSHEGEEKARLSLGASSHGKSQRQSREKQGQRSGNQGNRQGHAGGHRNKGQGSRSQNHKKGQGPSSEDRKNGRGPRSQNPKTGQGSKNQGSQQRKKGKRG